MKYRTSFVCIKLSKILWLITAILILTLILHIHLKSRGRSRQEDRFLAQARFTRDRLNEQNMKGLKLILEDPATSLEKREEASKKLIQAAENTDKEMRIEIVLKSKGYDRVVCYVDGKSATVMIKSLNPLKSSELHMLENLLKDTFRLENIKIQTDGLNGSFYGFLQENAAEVQHFCNNKYKKTPK